MDKLGRDKDEEVSRIQSKKDQELQHILMAAKAQESELQSMLQKQRADYEKQVNELEEVKTSQLAVLTEQHQELVSQLRDEMETLTKVHKADTGRIMKEKGTIIAQLENEKSSLVERMAKLHQAFDEKCEDSRNQYEHMRATVAEQKSQLDTSSLNARRLETELTMAERQIQNLQSKLDHIKSDASEQVETLKARIMEAANALKKLEASQDDDQMTIKLLRDQVDALQRQGTDVQKQAEKALQHIGTTEELPRAEAEPRKSSEGLG